MDVTGAQRRLLIHIGYHKTGTSTLQDHLFRGGNSPFEQSPRGRSALQQDIVGGGPFQWISEEHNARLAGEIADCNSRGHHFVISHERLSGYFATGGFDSCVIADRLRQTFPDARILIVLREQASMVLSVYSQYVTDGGVLCFHRFLRGLQPHYRRVPGFDLDFYEYDRLIAYYQTLFDAENVLVLPFEMMVADPGEFGARLYRFCGYDVPPDHGEGFPVVNGRRCALGQAFTRQFNRALWCNQLNPAGLFEGDRAARVMRRISNTMTHLTRNRLLAPVDDYLDRRRRAALHKAIHGRYAASNRRVEKLTGLDLGRYGYCLSDPGAEIQASAPEQAGETRPRLPDLVHRSAV